MEKAERKTTPLPRALAADCGQRRGAEDVVSQAEVITRRRSARLPCSAGCHRDGARTHGADAVGIRADHPRRRLAGRFGAVVRAVGAASGAVPATAAPCAAGAGPHVQTLAARLARAIRIAPLSRRVAAAGAAAADDLGGAGPRARAAAGRLLERLDDDQLAALLAHELAHVRRGDHWVRRLEFIVLGLFWWYPLAWWARTRLQAAEEECCDAWVVEALPARAYASAIVATVDFLANDLARSPGAGERPGPTRRPQAPPDPDPHRHRRRSGSTSPAASPFSVLALGLLPLLPTLAHSEKKPDAPALPKPEAQEVEHADAGDEALAFRPTPLNLTGGENEVAALAVSRDGRYLAAGTGYVEPARRSARLDRRRPQGSAGLRHRPGSRDGGVFAGRPILWPPPVTTARRLSANFPPARSLPCCPWTARPVLAFSPDGRRSSPPPSRKTIKCWNTATGNEIARLDNDEIRCYCVDLFARRQVAGRRRRRPGQRNDSPNEVTALGRDDLEAGRQIGRPRAAGHVRRLLGRTRR